MQKQKKRKRLSAKRKQRIRQRNIRILMAIIIGIVVIWGGSFAYFYNYVNKYEKDVACSNVFVGETDVSGFTEAEIRSVLEEQGKAYSLNKVTLVAGEKSLEVTLADLGFSIKNIEKAAEDAVDYGKEGSLLSRYKKIHNLKKESYVIEEQFAVNEELATQIIEEHTDSLEKKAVNAAIKRSGGTFIITDATQGNTVNIEQSLENLRTVLNKNWDYKEIEIELVQELEEPTIKRADLETIQDELGSFWTQAGGGTRLKNLERATELLNGTVVMPGEEISVEALTKPYTLENGYVEGSAYENGQVVTSIAGGLCQVSSTLYNALLYAEVDITERSAHSMLVSYVKPSRDAAIAEDVKDLKFQNNYDTPIYIEGYIDSNNYLYFKVYGKEVRPSNRTVEYESEVLETTEYTTKYVADSGNVVGYISDEDGTAINGKVAKLWKIVYEDGKQVSKETENNSTYKASTVTVKVGVKSENTDASEIVKAAIESQDESKIKSAISKAKALEAEAEKEEQTEETTEELNETEEADSQEDGEE